MMSREIKFRAFDRATGAMHQPGDNVWRLWLDGGVSIEGTWATGDVELMQFTGLTDKNDVEVFEGDIVKIFTDGEEDIIEVTFTVDRDLNGWEITPQDIEDGLEVIGSIHQHPELLN